MEKKEKQERNEKNDNITVSVTSGAFPLNLWREWDKDCKENFGDVRWLKMWHDHLMAKRFEEFLKLYNEYLDTKKTLNMLIEDEIEEQKNEEKEEKEKKENKKVVKTLGGNIEYEEGR